MSTLSKIKDAIGKSADGLLKLKTNNNRASLDNGNVYVEFNVQSDDLEATLNAVEFSSAISALGEIENITQTRGGRIVLHGKRSRIMLSQASGMVDTISESRWKIDSEFAGVDISPINRSIAIPTNKNGVVPLAAVYIEDEYVYTTDGVVIIANPCEWCKFKFKIPYSYMWAVNAVSAVSETANVQLSRNRLILSAENDYGMVIKSVIPQSNAHEPPAIKYIRSVPEGGPIIKPNDYLNAVSKGVGFTGSNRVNLHRDGGKLVISVTHDDREMKSEIDIEGDGEINADLFSLYAKLIVGRDAEWVQMADEKNIIYTRSSSGTLAICAKLSK